MSNGFRSEATALLAAEISNEPRFLLSNLTPSKGQRRLALAAAFLLIAAFSVTAPFVTIQLPRVDAFIPLLQSTFFVCDVITTILLFTQFSIGGSPAVLILASGYLFVSLVVVVHLLTFPGVFSPSGLLGAGLQSAAWLYFFWQFGFVASVLAYVYLKRSDRRVRSTRLAIVCSSLLATCLVCGIAWLCTRGEQFLPPIFYENLERTPLISRLGIGTIAIGAAALAVLWTYRRSVLDEWLMVVTLASTLEMALLGIMSNASAARFHLGFYAGRMFTLLASLTILIALITEMARADFRLARANTMLERERANKLMSAAAVAASISHELQQPLTAIVMAGNKALQWIQRSPPQAVEVRAALAEIVSQCHHASQAFENIADLFKGGSPRQVPVNVNKVVVDVFQILSRDLARHHITVRIRLAEGLPVIAGQSGQLQSVLLSLITSAIEATEMVKGKRSLRLSTERRASEGVAIMVEVSGIAFDPVKLAALLDPAVVSKTQGAALGLTICQMIIEQHGGQLIVQCGPESRSVTLQFIFPTQSADALLGA